jgi:hypothetical protein
LAVNESRIIPEILPVKEGADAPPIPCAEAKDIPVNNVISNKKYFM